METGLAAIRAAEPSDASGVWSLARAFATSFPLERAAFDRSYPALLAEANSLVLVATTPERGVAGYLLAHTHTTFLANGQVAWIEEVMVDPRMRLRGVGRALIAGAEGWARATGARHVALASRRAGPFYLALGFEDSATYFKKPLSERA